MEKTGSKLFTKKFTIAFILALLIWSSQNLIQTVLPLYLTSKMGSSLTEIGLIISISTFSTIVMRPFLGYIVDRGGRRLTLLTSTAAFGLISIAYLFAKTPAMIGLIRLLQGIPFAAATTALGAIASDLIPAEKRGEGLSYFTLTSTLAIAIGPSLGIALFNSGWPVLPFLTSAIVLIICFFASMLIDIPNIKIENKKFSISNLIDSKIGWLVVISALSFFGIPGIMTYSTLYSQSLGIENISLAYAMYGIGLVLTRILTAQMIDKKGVVKMGKISLFILMIGFGVIGLIPSMYGLFVGSIILSGGIGIITPTLFTMAVDVVDLDRRGSCTAMIFAGFDIGMGLGSLFFGWISDKMGSYSVAYSTYALVELVGLGIFACFAGPHYMRNKNERLFEPGIITEK